MHISTGLESVTLVFYTPWACSEVSSQLVSSSALGTIRRAEQKVREIVTSFPPNPKANSWCYTAADSKRSKRKSPHGKIVHASTVSHLLISHWLEKVTWRNPEPTDRVTNSVLSTWGGPGNTRDFAAIFEPTVLGHQ